MNRNEFLKVLGFGSAGLILPGTQFLSSKKIKIYDNYIKGIAHYQYKNLVKIIKIGEEVLLKRDIANIYDSFAVEVYFKDQKIGYLAAYENIVISNIIEQGVELKAFVSQIHNSGHLYNDIAIEVFAEVIIHSPGIIQTTNLEKRADDVEDIYRTNY
jgi:hypothetical protein